MKRQPPTGTVTQEQVALKLGVSRQLVTFALGNYPQVSEKSRRRILAAAEEMGYRPNPHALALRSKRTGIVALWIPDLISTHYSHVARELSRMVKLERNELIISEVGTVEAEELVSHLPIDGVIAVECPGQVTAFSQTSSARSNPIVSMGARCAGKMDSVQVDLLAGTKAVMSHLLGLGFRRIAHATFVQNDDPQESRKFGYQEAMRRAGLQAEFIYYPLTERQRPVTRQLIQDYVREHGCPEAIFCHSDDAALGIYRGLRDMNLRVPEDVALVGCDGIEDAEYLECPLTTLVQPVPEMCAAAWEFLRRRLKDPLAKVQRIILKPELRVRESSRRSHRLPAVLRS